MGAYRFGPLDEAVLTSADAADVMAAVGGVPSLSEVYRRAVNLMEADLGDELVALDPKGGNCFGFNEVATWVWRRLAQPTSFDHLRDGLLDEYEVSAEQCTTELKALLDYLVERGLVATVLQES